LRFGYQKTDEDYDGRLKSELSFACKAMRTKKEEKVYEATTRLDISKYHFESDAVRERWF
jgi:hypothetical protein